jgi:hypothetical protein
LPGGPPPQCGDTGVYGEQNQGSKLQLGIGLGSLSSILRFDGSNEVEIDMKTISIAGSWQLSKKWSIRTGLGLVYDGKLKPDDVPALLVKSGGLVAVGIEYLYYRGEGFSPSINISVSLSASSSKIENPNTLNKTNYFASDLRFGGLASWNIKGKVFPYFSGRVFGGPVKWELDEIEVTGTDIHHYQLAIGAAVQIGGRGAFVEWAGLGEKSLSAGLSYVW